MRENIETIGKVQVELVPFANEGEFTPGWHLHLWTTWGKVFGAGGFTAMFVGDKGPWYQDRFCVKCNKVQRRNVEV